MFCCVTHLSWIRIPFILYFIPVCDVSVRYRSHTHTQDPFYVTFPFQNVVRRKSIVYMCRFQSARRNQAPEAPGRWMWIGDTPVFTRGTSVVLICRSTLPSPYKLHMKSNICICIYIWENDLFANVHALKIKIKINTHTHIRNFTSRHTLLC